MAWMLLEWICKSLVDATIAYYILKGNWRVMMSKTCLITGCAKFAGASTRGLCLQCYGRAKKKVEAGETTWERLAERGLCEEEKSPFDDAYSQAMKEGE